MWAHNTSGDGNCSAQTLHCNSECTCELCYIEEALVSTSYQGVGVVCPAHLGIFQLGCKANVTHIARGVVARRQIVCVQVILAHKHAAAAYFRVCIRDVLNTPRIGGVLSRSVGA